MVHHGAARSGALFSCREMGLSLRGMLGAAFAPAAPVFWREACESSQAPGTVLHCPFAAGNQEKNCCCA